MNVSPEVLVFTPPFVEEETRPLILTNTSSHRYAFKVKTTVPSLYCVRPNCAVIAAGETVELQIIRQPFNSEPVPGQRYKDKFQVQSFPLPDSAAIDEKLPLSEIWTKLESEATSKTTSTKIKVQYEFPNSSANAKSSTLPPAYDESAHDTSIYKSPVEPEKPSAAPVTSSGVASSSTAAASGLRQRLPDDVQPEIDSTNAKIASMNRDMKQTVPEDDDNALTTTKTNVPTSKPSNAAAPGVHSSSGLNVPLPLVATLLIVAFLFGWKFF